MKEKLQQIYESSNSSIEKMLLEILSKETENENYNQQKAFSDETLIKKITALDEEICLGIFQIHNEDVWTFIASDEGKNVLIRVILSHYLLEIRQKLGIKNDL